MPPLHYSTPGAYYERVDAGVPAVSPVRMDVAAFVGIAERGPLHTPVPIESWRQFVAYFGSFTGSGYLAYCVRGFFENGGARCWVVRVASDAATTAAAVFTAGGALAWQVAAAGPGVWGSHLTAQLQAGHRSQTITRPADSRPEFSTVAGISGFARGTHVRLVWPDGSTALRVVSSVDAERRRLYWVNPDPRLRLPYDAPIALPDPNAVLVIESIEYALLVRELGQLVAIYDGLSLVPEHPRYGPSVLPGLEIDPSQPATWHIAATPEPIVIVEQRASAAIAALAPLDLGATPTPVPLTSGGDGLAALTVLDFIGEAIDPLDSDEVKRRKQRGLRALDPIGEIAAVAVPDIHVRPVPPPDHAPLPACIPDPCLPSPPPGPAIPPAAAVGDLPPVFSDTDVARVQDELVLHCERHADRLALLDPPVSVVADSRLGLMPAIGWRQRFDSSYAVIYYPWLEVIDPIATDAGRLTRRIPPSGHVAGFYAASDRATGVYKAPANAPLTWLQDLTTAVDDVGHGVLNDAGLCAIRALPGRGLRILGARTVSSDTDWRFVNVRRLLIMIERALHLACQWAVFEPNSVRTRGKLHLSLTSFLLALWQQGALAGATPQAAFYVKCADSNNPPATRDLGELIAEIGVAPSVPFEFVVVRIGREDNQFRIAEDTSAGGPH